MKIFLMPFSNRIRLPMKLTRPQFSDTRNVYTKADGSTQTLSVVVQKNYEGETSWMPEKWHERLKIALSHDVISIEGDKYFGGVVEEGDYEISWEEFLDYPTAKAKFKVNVTPFDGTNANCQTCEEVSQAVAHDDTFPSPLDENTNYTLDLAANDNICCFPATFSIIYNSAYIDVPTIDADGTLHIHTKTGLVAANSLLLATYRITCPNGGFDDANVYADINGTVPGCLAPIGLIFNSSTTTTAELQWTNPSPIPDHYFWKLYTAANPATPVQTGDATTAAIIDLSGLTPGTDYFFYVRSQCDPTDDDATSSNFVSYEFTTPPVTNNCGSYEIHFNSPSDPDAAHGGHININYLACDGTIQTVYVPNFIPRGICAMQTSPGTPTNISSGGVPVTYLGLCP